MKPQTYVVHAWLPWLPRNPGKEQIREAVIGEILDQGGPEHGRIQYFGCDLYETGKGCELVALVSVTPRP